MIKHDFPSRRATQSAKLTDVMVFETPPFCNTTPIIGGNIVIPPCQIGT